MQNLVCKNNFSKIKFIFQNRHVYICSYLSASALQIKKKDKRKKKHKIHAIVKEELNPNNELNIVMICILLAL
jgi:hypothetical protein